MLKLKTLLFIAFLIQSEACKSPEKESSTSGPAFDKETYSEFGEKIVSQTFASLSDHLNRALEQGGVETAAEYCNVRALPLTDSIANEKGVVVRRVSAKFRNPENKPGPIETEIISLFESNLKQGITLSQEIREISDNEVGYFAPILVMPPCLQCHGKLGETLDPDNYAYLKEKYPADHAIGYEVGDLRGVWSITIPKTQFGNNSKE
jgi:hypothetical protein